ncbi:152_t:CDS:1, partial [Cetraspora pellucida]
NANSQKTIEKESIQENDLEIDESIEESSFSQEYNLSNMNDIDYVDIDMEIYHVDNMNSSGNMDDTGSRDNINSIGDISDIEI